MDGIIGENKKEHNPNWPESPDHPYRMTITAGSGSGKIKALLNLMSHHTDINKIYL